MTSTKDKKFSYLFHTHGQKFKHNRETSFQTVHLNNVTSQTCRIQTMKNSLSGKLFNTIKYMGAFFVFHTQRGLVQLRTQTS